MYKTENFGKNLSKIMKSLGMSQSELATRTGLTRAAVCQILKNQRDPMLSTVVQILNVIPVSLERLLK